jgi:hypothetical protein
MAHIAAYTKILLVENMALQVEGSTTFLYPNESL